MRLFTCLLLSALISGSQAQAKPSDVVAFAETEEYTITVTEIDVPAEHRRFFSELADRVPTFQETAPGSKFSIPNPMDIGNWVNLGKQIWDIITGLAGTMKIEPMVGVGVVPEGAGSSFTAMSGWKTAKPKSYRMEIQGQFANAFRFQYTVGYNYGGKHQGKGQFLANVAVVPFDAKCGWTWNCVATVNVGSAINVGTDDEPVAAIPLNMIVNIQGKVNAKAMGAQFMVHGDGRLEQTVQDLGEPAAAPSRPSQGYEPPPRRPRYPQGYL